MSTELRRINGKPVLRFERVLAHPPAKVWRAITEPGELAHWFPAAVAVDGREMTFSFPDQVTTGEVLESDPPRVFAFRWNTDVLRFELLPHERGCLLVFTHVLGGEQGAARNAAGWDTCLAGLVARLADRPFEPPADVREPVERYLREFGLDEGRFDGGVVRFVRDLVWRPLDEVWSLLTEGEQGVPPRAANPHVPPGPLVERTEPRVLAFDSPTGRVRWEFRHGPDQGTEVELTHVLADPAFAPQALAAWHAHLELFFAALFGDLRCPWPEDRVEELIKHYREHH
ncbi:SRPBCC family protein [Saccharothrix sp. HUAS TT1]|uniref:SRPBCC family protein n=1 Tax=unclassified Saccharothrix TaxID=2593673 RepID=UPI00345B4D68